MNQELNRRIRDAAMAARWAFWSVITVRFPEAKTGDFDPLSSDQFDLLTENAVKHWVESNVPGAAEGGE